jgi:hypothetical protein
VYAVVVRGKAIRNSFEPVLPEANYQQSFNNRREKTQMAKEHDTESSWVERSNSEVASAVNRGLAVALFEGISAGAKIMSAQGVPLEVSARVLGNHKRRATDWQ